MSFSKNLRRSGRRTGVIAIRSIHIQNRSLDLLRVVAGSRTKP